MQASTKPKRKFYKKWWFWVLILLIIAVAGNNSEDQATPTKKAESTKSTAIKEDMETTDSSDAEETEVAVK